MKRHEGGQASLSVGNSFPQAAAGAGLLRSRAGRRPEHKPDAMMTRQPALVSPCSRIPFPAIITPVGGNQISYLVNHVHTVFREPENDCGDDILKKHLGTGKK